jgi:hypothetical protein
MSRTTHRRFGHEQVAAWISDPNEHQAQADWQFIADNARVKLTKSLHPIFPVQNR